MIRQVFRMKDKFPGEKSEIRRKIIKKKHRYVDLKFSLAGTFSEIGDGKTRVHRESWDPDARSTLRSRHVKADEYIRRHDIYIYDNI